MKEIIHDGDKGKVTNSTKKQVSFVFERLKLISSGHAECPVPKSVEELIMWWATEPPK